LHVGRVRDGVEHVEGRAVDAVDERAVDVVTDAVRQILGNEVGHQRPPIVKPSVGVRYCSPAAMSSRIFVSPASVGSMSGERTWPLAMRPRWASTHLPGAGLVSTKSRSTSGCRP